MPKETLYKNIFNKLGISETQSDIYEFLLKNGTCSASEIANKTSIKRSLVYNALSELEKKNLIFSDNNKTKTTFSPNHPEKLRSFIDEKEKEVQNVKSSFESILPNIIEDFNSVSSKGSTRYMEGYDGVKKCIKYLFENFNKNEEIFSFSYMTPFVNDKELESAFNEYASIRKKNNLHQKTILSDNGKTIKELQSMEGYKNEKNLFIDYAKFPFSSDITIFNNKILIISSKKGTPCVTLIDNTELYNTLRSIFNLIWGIYNK